MQIKIVISSIYSFLFFMSFISYDLTNDSGGGGGGGVLAQEPVFELPVQLVGFPAIILAVRFTNFVKKLQYSLNPQTYKSTNSSRQRRSSAFISDSDAANINNNNFTEISHEAIDISIAEKRILSELGPKACVMEEPCKIHAARSSQIGEQPDWTDILRNYKVHSTGMKQWYLLSVFLGDVIRDISLCKQLAKRLSCDRNEKPFIRD